MLNLLLQTAMRRRPSTFSSFIRHLGAFGLFILAIVDSTPIPTFGGPDILMAVLVVRHRNPWFEYAAVATVGSIIGAYLTYRVAQSAGSAYTNSKFAKGRLSAGHRLFETWGAGALAVSTAVPFPFPTSMFFAVAGASNYPLAKYLVIVFASRAVRYSVIALIADLYGRHFIRVLRNPGQYWGWLVLFAAVAAGLALAGILINKRMANSAS